jgi:tetratricopeptide (TPR) repeat protein
MDISPKAISKITERYLLEHPRELRKFREKGRLLFIDLRNMSTEDILKRLKEIGLEIDKKSMEKLCPGYYSAYEMALELRKKQGIEFKNANDDDFFWMSLTVLWEKWFPELINIEMLDDMMQEGYDLIDRGETEAGLHKWWDTWQGIKEIMHKFKIRNINSFDSIFKGTQSVFNWSSDFDLELANAMLKEKKYAEKRITFCSEYIERYGNKKETNIKNMEVSIAESYFQSGQKERGNSLFEQCIKKDPEMVTGWIIWADQYQREKNLERALEILGQGLTKVRDAKDRIIILERIKDIYSELKMRDKEKEVDHLIKKEENKMNLHKDSGGKTIVKGFKPGRNDPCPCGSGKKYKKCCGR